MGQSCNLLPGNTLTPRRRKARVKREFRGNKSARVYTAPFSELEDDDCGRTDEESLDGSTGRLRKGLSVSALLF